MAARRPIPRAWMVVALDLRDGSEVWRFAETGVMVFDVGIGKGLVYAALGEGPSDLRLQVIEPRRGTNVRSWPVRRPLRRVHPTPAGRDLVLLIADGNITAVRSLDGKDLWSIAVPAPNVQGATPQAPPPVLRDDHLLISSPGRVRELEITAGREVASWDLPAGLQRSASQIAIRSRDALLVLQYRDRDNPWADQSVLITRFEHVGASPSFASLPCRLLNEVVALDPDRVVVAEEGGLAAYSTVETTPSELATSPRERVRAILERGGPPTPIEPGRRSMPAGALDDLRAVPGHGAELETLIADPGAPLRDAALDAAIALQTPGLSALLLAEIERPLARPTLVGPYLPPVDDPLAAGGQVGARARAGQQQPIADGSVSDRAAVEAYRRALGRKDDLVVALAALDDAHAADRLAHLLIEARSPTGLGLFDWNVWGASVDGALGRTSWGGPAAEARRAAHLDDRSGAEGFSACLPALEGRPASHAAIYRLLARLSRPSDLRALERLARAAGRPGGWARICSEDDRLADRDDQSQQGSPRGLCRGRSVGDFRVTQAGAIWIRRRLANGAWGPPAWARGPDQDVVFHPRELPAGEWRDGRIQLAGTGIRGSGIAFAPWSATIDPAEVFADRDGDGLPDLTERAFGTDPARADTDGDGLSDGRDPAPLAAAAHTEAGRVEEEVVRYWTLFHRGGPLATQVDRGLWAGGTGPAGLVLHAPPPPAPPIGAVRTMPCSAPLAIESLHVTGAGAEAVVTWPETEGADRRQAAVLGLRRLRSGWRVVSDRPR
jgi:hypothetical protein